MRIQFLSSKDYDTFFTFQEKVYPQRTAMRERFRFQFLQNPLLVENKEPPILLAFNSENQLIGQYGVNLSQYTLNGEVVNSFSGCDLFVFDEYRKYGIGGLLSMKAITHFQPHFSIGVSADALPLLQSLKMKCVGEARIHVWARSVLPFEKFFSSLFRQRHHEKIDFLAPVQSDDLPAEVAVREQCFVRRSTPPRDSWSKLHLSVLEFCRDFSFFQWRFFTLPGYGFYESTSGGSYFVVRKTRWRGVSFLALVDYRVPINDAQRLTSMLSAVKSIARKSKCAGVVTLSSHSFYHRGLRRQFFFPVGAPLQAFTNAPLSFSDEMIKNHQTIVVTMADADLEFAFWPKKNDKNA